MAGKGAAYASVGVGGLLLWSAIMNKGVFATLQDVVSGKAPTPGPTQSFSNTLPTSTTTTSVDTSTSTDQGSVTASGSLQGYAKSLLALHGWSGQWKSFNAVELQEAGWNPRAKNSSSGALGLAQALGHGNANTAGSLGNEYGGNGLSDADAKKANSGDGYTQLVWMVNYIAARYGSPDAAESFHLKNGWY